MTQFSEYYKRELRLLRERAAEFAEEHPSLAGLLGGPSADPDVERLLEGVAFLGADIRRELDDDHSELLHGLAQMVCPHLVQPVPSATVMLFRAKPNLKKTLTVKAGTHVESVPVDGFACRFRTTLDTPVTPLRIVRVERPDLELERPSADAGVQIRLRLDAGESTLETLEMPSLRFFIAGDFSDATDLFMLLTHYLRSVRIVERGSGRVVDLPAAAVRPLGFADDELLLPRAGHMLPAYSLLQDYFLFPEKYLFFEVNLRDWRERGGGSVFDLTFDCDQPPFAVPNAERDTFVLHAVPAVNLFARDAEPVVMDHRDGEYPLQPSGADGHTLWVHSVDRVEGIARGAAGRREYQPFSAFITGATDVPVYQVKRRRRAGADATDIYLAPALPASQPLERREVLKASLTCTNAERAESLLPNDIQTPTRDTPELVSFTNLSTPTAARRPTPSDAILWQLIANLSLNYLSVADADNLKALLRQYAVPGGEERGRDAANLKRIDSVSQVSIRPDERLLGEAFVRGQAIRVRLRFNHFAGYGDCYLFGSVLNRFFASSSALNTFTVFSVEDQSSGVSIEWPPMLGTRRLL